MAGGVGREDTDLAVVDLSGEAGVLPRHPGRRDALLDEPSPATTFTRATALAHTYLEKLNRNDPAEPC
jgi:hypothetical protein